MFDSVLKWAEKPKYNEIHDVFRGQLVRLCFSKMVWYKLIFSLSLIKKNTKKHKERLSDMNHASQEVQQVTVNDWPTISVNIVIIPPHLIL